MVAQPTLCLVFCAALALAVHGEHTHPLPLAVAGGKLQLLARVEVAAEPLHAASAASAPNRREEAAFPDARFASLRRGPALEVLSPLGKDFTKEKLRSDANNVMFTARWQPDARSQARRVSVRLLLHDQPPMHDAPNYNNVVAQELLIKDRDWKIREGLLKQYSDELKVHLALRASRSYARNTVNILGVVYTLGSAEKDYFNANDYHADTVDAYLTVSGRRTTNIRGLIYEPDCVHTLSHVVEDKTVPFSTRLEQSIKLLSALEWLHGYNVVHRNIGASQVYVCGGDDLGKGEVKLGNLHHAWIRTKEEAAAAVKAPVPSATKKLDALDFHPIFPAPEVHDFGFHVGGVDVWAAGMVVGQLLMSKDDRELTNAILSFGTDVLTNAKNQKSAKSAIATNVKMCADNITPFALDPSGPFPGIANVMEKGVQDGKWVDGAGAKFIHVHLAAEISKALKPMLGCDTLSVGEEKRVTAAEAKAVLTAFNRRLGADFNNVETLFTVAKKSQTDNTNKWREVGLKTTHCGAMFHSWALIGQGAERCINLAAIPCAKLKDCITPLKPPAALPSDYKSGSCWEVKVGWTRDKWQQKWQLCRKEKDAAIEDVETFITGWYAV